MNQSFWQHKKVFITGHTGFKGSWLSLWLQSLDSQVSGFSIDPPTQPNLFELAKVANGMQSIYGDVRDLTQISRALQQTQPDIVIHMAAQPLVHYSYQYPVETYMTNIMGTVNLFEAVRNCDSIKVVLNVTSDKCYENKEWDWAYREDEAMGGYDPYSSSKGCAELITSAYRNSFFNLKEFKSNGKAIATARAGNVIGGGDWNKNRLIPDIIRAFTHNEAVHIRNPNAIRPWQHVLEPLSGYLLLAEKLWHEPAKFSQAWNFGPYESDMQPVRYITDRLVQMWGNGAQWAHDQTHFNHEAQTLKLDISKAKNKLNWFPHLSLEQALQQVVDWYKAWQQNNDMREITLEQIRSYCKLNNQAVFLNKEAIKI